MNIVITSILKPLDDVRHFHKLGLSLAKIPNTNVHIAARAVAYDLDKYPQVHFHAISPAKYSTLHRLIAPWKALTYFIKVKPELIVCCTFELLIVIILYKILFGTKIIYDIQENYGQNIEHNSGKGTFSKIVGRWYIHTIETLARPFISHYWVAEACYRQQMPWIDSKNTVLENKSLFFIPKENIVLSPKTNINLLYSGTVAVENGIYEAIELATALHKLDARYRLTIIGCCHQTDTLKEIEKQTLEKRHFIHLIVSNIPIKYELIKNSVLKADIGLICYRPQLNFLHKIPTKLFEYTAAGIPILLQQNPVWESFCEDYKNTITTDYQTINTDIIHTKIQNTQFYPKGNANTFPLTWASEEKKLIESIMQMFKEQ